MYGVVTCAGAKFLGFGASTSGKSISAVVLRDIRTTILAVGAHRIAKAIINGLDAVLGRIGIPVLPIAEESSKWCARRILGAGEPNSIVIPGRHVEVEVL